jgi:hypothetical protein
VGGRLHPLQRGTVRGRGEHALKRGGVMGRGLTRVVGGSEGKGETCRDSPPHCPDQQWPTVSRIWRIPWTILLPATAPEICYTGLGRGCGQTYQVSPSKILLQTHFIKLLFMLLVGCLFVLCRKERGKERGGGGGGVRGGEERGEMRG